jgi:hypothetical protein
MHAANASVVLNSAIASAATLANLVAPKSDAFARYCLKCGATRQASALAI